MPNGYAVVPNVLPGNVTIGGNLTVGGDQLRIGAAAPFVRLGKLGTGQLWLAENIGFDATTRDNGALLGAALLNELNTRPLVNRQISLAGNFIDTADPLVLLSDYTLHLHTGTVTEDTIYSKLIRGGYIGANGGIRFHGWMDTNVQGAVNTNVRIKLGATVLFQSVFGANINLMWDVFVANRNAQNSQISHAWSTNLASGAIIPGFSAPAVDTSVDQTFSVTVQNGAVTDSQNFETGVLELVNSFGPV